jgi:hypothetical protein
VIFLIVSFPFHRVKWSEVTEGISLNEDIVFASCPHFIGGLLHGFRGLGCADTGLVPA